MTDINITEIEYDQEKRTAKVEVKGKGIRGLAEVGVSYTEVHSVSSYDRKTGETVDLPAFLAPIVYLNFKGDGDLVINGKTYSKYFYRIESSPGRYTRDDGNNRVVLTDSGIAELGYYECSVYGSDLSDSASEKLEKAARLCADKYLTYEAARAAYVRKAKSELDTATRDLGYAEKKQSVARDRLAAMEALKV